MMKIDSTSEKKRWQSGGILILRGLTWPCGCSSAWHSSKQCREVADIAMRSTDSLYTCPCYEVYRARSWNTIAWLIMIEIRISSIDSIIMHESPINFIQGLDLSSVNRVNLTKVVFPTNK